MKLKQVAAIAGLCVAGFLFAYGLSLLKPPIPALVQVEELQGPARESIEKHFELAPGNIVLLRASEEPYGLVEIYPNGSEGGGFWALLKQTPDGLTVVDSGNKPEYEVECAVLEESEVPPTMSAYCTKDSVVFDRRTGETIADPLALPEQHPIPAQ